MVTWIVISYRTPFDCYKCGKLNKGNSEEGKLCGYMHTYTNRISSWDAHALSLGAV